MDKWTPFNQLMTKLPFYRIIGDDSSYIYVSSKTGEIVQQCTLSERRWAWVGALPHYVYITPIRRDAKLWRTIVIWMSGLSTVSVIFSKRDHGSGIILGDLFSDYLCLPSYSAA